MTKFLGNPEISVEALKTMRERALLQDKWYAYQNHALDSAGLGDLQFLQIGPGQDVHETTGAYAGHHPRNRMEVFAGRRRELGNRTDRGGALVIEKPMLAATCQDFGEMSRYDRACRNECVCRAGSSLTAGQ